MRRLNYFQSRLYLESYTLCMLCKEAVSQEVLYLMLLSGRSSESSEVQISSSNFQNSNSKYWISFFSVVVSKYFVSCLRTFHVYNLTEKRKNYDRRASLQESFYEPDVRAMLKQFELMEGNSAVWNKNHQERIELVALLGDVNEYTFLVLFIF